MKHLILFGLFLLVNLSFAQQRDSYENDNSRQSATSIVPGEIQKHSIFPANDRDWFVFTPTEAGIFLFEIQKCDIQIKGDIFVEKGALPAIKLKSFTSKNGSAGFSLTPDADNVNYYIGIWGNLANDVGGYEVLVKDGNISSLSNNLAKSSNEEICGNMTVYYESQMYHTVQIGSQCWLKENLNIGVQIPGYQNQTKNGIIEKYCYDNNPSNCSIYGGLYQWEEAINYSVPIDYYTKGICPTGWHIPTYNDLQSLKSLVNSSNKLKARGEGTGDGAGTNTTGFSALLGGTRNPDGRFHDFNSTTIFSSSADNSNDAFRMHLYFSNSDINLNYHKKDYGFSVRCIKN